MYAETILAVWEVPNRRSEEFGLSLMVRRSADGTTGGWRSMNWGRASMKVVRKMMVRVASGCSLCLPTTTTRCSATPASIPSSSGVLTCEMASSDIEALMALPMTSLRSRSVLKV
jgi:hypothetical protein